MYLTLWCRIPEAATSTEPVRLMANVGFLSEGFKDKKYNDRKDRNKYEAPRVLAYRKGASKILRKKYSSFQYSLQEPTSSGLIEVFTIVHCSSF